MPVYLVAPGLPAYLDPLPDAWTFHGECSAEELRGLMANSRIVLNPVVKFPQGAHDRVFQAQALGAAVATPHSQFLAADYAEGASILFIDPVGDPAGVARTLRTALGNVAALERLAAGGRTIYAGRHTWRHRAAQIAAALSQDA